MMDNWENKLISYWYKNSDGITEYGTFKTNNPSWKDEIILIISKRYKRNKRELNSTQFSTKELNSNMNIIYTILKTNVYLDFESKINGVFVKMKR